MRRPPAINGSCWPYRHEDRHWLVEQSAAGRNRRTKCVQNVCVDMELAARSRSIGAPELGRRIKAARLAAGLTQVALASGLVTAAYISRIEAGQRRPDLRVLSAFCDRMGIGLDELLAEAEGTAADAIDNELQLALDYAELNLTSGNPQGALDSLGRYGSSPGTPNAPAVEGPQGFRVQYLEAMAYEALGKVAEALPRLEAIAAHPRSDRDWLRAMIALSRTYRETGQFAKAVTSGEAASAVVDDLGLADTTESIQLTLTIAGGYLVQGDLDRAMSVCQRALETAQKTSSLTGQASAYWNASVIAARQYEYGDALRLAGKALALLEVGEDFRNLARLRIQVGHMHLKSSPPDAAAAKAALETAASELSWTAANAFDKADHQVATAHADWLLGDLAASRAALDHAESLVGDTSPQIRAQVEVLRGQVAMQAGEREEARGAYLRAVHWLAGIASDRDIAELWFELAGLLESAGADSEALDAYKRGAVASGLLQSAKVLHPTSS